MYVCICAGVTDKQIRELAAQGVSEMSELTMRSGCASQCGSCRDMALDILNESKSVALPFALPVLAAA
jgi:bacterioferritin-associated ferredoxin